MKMKFHPTLPAVFCLIGITHSKLAAQDKPTTQAGGSSRYIVQESLPPDKIAQKPDMVDVDEKLVRANRLLMEKVKRLESENERLEKEIEELKAKLKETAAKEVVPVTPAQP